MENNCITENCEYPQHCRELCIRHYRQQLHTERSECRVEGCATKWHSSGLCVKHYSRLRSWGTTDDPEPLPLKESCSVVDCTGAIKARELCGMHLRRWYKWGTTDLPERAKERTCNRCGKSFPIASAKTTKRICLDCYPLWRQEYSAIRLSRASGVTRTVTELREKQRGRCAICDIPEEEAPKKRLHLDHDHKTGVIRALLCGNCNVGIGHFRESIELLQAAIDYLQSSSSPS